jgi:hypothetical protein
LLPLILLLVFAVLVWRFHLGALPRLAEIRGFFGL